MHKKHKIVVYWHAWLLFIVLAKKQKKNNYCLFIMHNKHKIVVYWHVWLLIMHNKQKVVGLLFFFLRKKKKTDDFIDMLDYWLCIIRVGSEIWIAQARFHFDCPFIIKY